MKKIAILMYYMNCGGVEIALINLLKRISPDYFHVDLYLVEKKGEFLERIPDYVNIIELKMTSLERVVVIERGIRPILKRSLFLGSKAILESLWLSAKYLIYRRLKIEFHDYKAVFGNKRKEFQQYDQVWDFHGYNSLSTYLAAHIFRASSKSFWIHSENVSEDAGKNPKTMMHFDNIYAVSSTCADIYNKTYGDNSAKVFHNFIDQESIIERAKEHVSLKTDDEILTLVTVGRLSHQKGYDTALCAAKLLRERRVVFKWYFVGGGDDEAMLKALCTEYDLNDNIVFVGFTSNPYSYMQACDIYVQPSRYEGYAVTLMEAIVLKKVIVTTNVSGGDEAVTDGYNGKIVHQDAEDIGQAIMDIWETPNKLYEMQENSNKKLLVQKNSEDILRNLLYATL